MSNDPVTDFETVIRREGKCCACGELIGNAKHINLIQTNYEVTWQFPRAGNMLTNVDGFAVGIAGSCCLNESTGELKKPLKHCIEFKQDKLIYHPVESLKLHPNCPRIIT